MPNLTFISIQAEQKRIICCKNYLSESQKFTIIGWLLFLFYGKCIRRNSVLQKLHSHPESQNVPYLEVGSLQMSLVKMRSYWIGVGLNLICLHKRGTLVKRNTNKKGRRWRQRLKWCNHRPRNNTWGHQKWEETGKDPSLEASKRVWPCQHLDFGLLVSRTNSETINFCCFKPPALR